MDQSPDTLYSGTGRSLRNTRARAQLAGGGNQDSEKANESDDSHDSFDELDAVRKRRIREELTPDPKFPMTPHKQRLYRDKKKYQKRLDEALERKWVEMEARKAAKQKGKQTTVSSTTAPPSALPMTPSDQPELPVDLPHEETAPQRHQPSRVAKSDAEKKRKQRETVVPATRTPRPRPSKSAPEDPFDPDLFASPSPTPDEDEELPLVKPRSSRKRDNVRVQTDSAPDATSPSKRQKRRTGSTVTKDTDPPVPKRTRTIVPSKAKGKGVDSPSVSTPVVRADPPASASNLFGMPMPPGAEKGFFTMMTNWMTQNYPGVKIPDNVLSKAGLPLPAQPQAQPTLPSPFPFPPPVQSGSRGTKRRSSKQDDIDADESEYIEIVYPKQEIKYEDGEGTHASQPTHPNAHLSKKELANEWCAAAKFYLCHVDAMRTWDEEMLTDIQQSWPLSAGPLPVISSADHAHVASSVKNKVNKMFTTFRRDFKQTIQLKYLIPASPDTARVLVAQPLLTDYMFLKANDAVAGRDRLFCRREFLQIFLAFCTEKARGEDPIPRMQPLRPNNDRRQVVWVGKYHVNGAPLNAFLFVGAMVALLIEKLAITGPEQGKDWEMLAEHYEKLAEMVGDGDVMVANVMTFHLSQLEVHSSLVTRPNRPTTKTEAAPKTPDRQHTAMPPLMEASSPVSPDTASGNVAKGAEKPEDVVMSHSDNGEDFELDSNLTWETGPSFGTPDEQEQMKSQEHEESVMSTSETPAQMC